jgi:hypothetical protein
MHSYVVRRSNRLGHRNEAKAIFKILVSTIFVFLMPFWFGLLIKGKYIYPFAGLLLLLLNNDTKIKKQN